mgnify:CR=1 FL=1
MKKLLVSVIALFGAVSLSAQDVTAIYNEAAAAFGAKNFTEAAAKFEQVIDQGMDNESAASMVATAKSTLPKCYFMLGGGALKTKNYDEALKNFDLMGMRFGPHRVAPPMTLLGVTCLAIPGLLFEIEAMAMA